MFSKMKRKYQELSQGLKDGLLKDKQTLYVYLGRNPDDAFKKLMSYTPRKRKSWHFMKYNQMLAIDDIRKKLNLEPLFFLEEDKESHNKSEQTSDSKQINSSNKLVLR
jgi:hypothetical protein